MEVRVGGGRKVGKEISLKKGGVGNRGGVFKNFPIPLIIKPILWLWSPFLVKISHLRKWGIKETGGEVGGGSDYDHYYDLKSITFVMLLFMNK